MVKKTLFVSTIAAISMLCSICQSRTIEFTNEQQTAIDKYADHFVKKQVVPIDVVNQIRLAKDEELRNTIGKKIAEKILTLSNGMFIRQEEFPDLIKSHFKQVTFDQIKAALEPFTCNDTLLGATQYMYNIGKRWVDTNADNEDIHNSIRRIKPDDLNSYINIMDALNRHQIGQAVPKYIVVNNDELAILKKEYISGMFNPDSELVLIINSPSDDVIFNFNGRFEINNGIAILKDAGIFLFPPSVHKITIVSQQLTSLNFDIIFDRILWYFNTKRSDAFLTSVTVPERFRVKHYSFQNKAKFNYIQDDSSILTDSVHATRHFLER